MNLHKFRRFTPAILLVILGAFVLGFESKDLSNAVFARVRAKTYEVWDQQRGGKVIDLEQSISELREAQADLKEELERVKSIAAKGYLASGAADADQRAVDKAASDAAAQRQKDELSLEIARLRATLEEARRQAANDAQRAVFDQMDQDLTRSMEAEAQQKELRRIRKALETMARP